MNPTTAILLEIFIIFAAAQAGGIVARWVRLPDVVGQIIAGCIVGPSVFGWITPSEPLEVLSEIGWCCSRWDRKHAWTTWSAWAAARSRWG